MERFNNQERVFYLDFLRAIGCLAVVLIHVSSIFTLEPYGTFNYCVGIVADGLSQFAVPLFVMISGSLFLNEAYILTKDKLLGHIKKCLLFFAGWSAIYCFIFTVLKGFLEGTPATILAIFVELLDGPYHLWFIPMLVGLYLVTPFLKLWVKRENKTYVQWFLWISFIINVVVPLAEMITDAFIPSLSSVFGIINKLKLHSVCGYVFYYVLGWYLHQYSFLNRNSIYVLGVTGIAFTIFGTFLFDGLGINSEYFFDNFSIGIVFWAVSIFVHLKTVLSKRRVFSGIVDQVCRYSMGIYAMHVGVFPLFTHILKIENAAFAIPVYFLIAVTGPVLGTIILKKCKWTRFLV